MILAGNKEGQVNVNMEEFINSEWLHNRMYRFISAMCECFSNAANLSPEATQYAKEAGEIMRLDKVIQVYYQWANANFEEFMADYKSYVRSLIGKEPNYLPHSLAGVARLHKKVMHDILPRWLDFRLGRPITTWRIDNTDPNQEYDIKATRERYGIGKKHFTEEQERIALEQKAAKRAAREPNSTARLDDYSHIPGIRTLSASDLELF